MRVLFSVLLSALVLMPPVAFAAEEARLRAAAKQLLTDLQSRSIENNREYCGVLLERPDGTLISSKAYRGTKSRCKVRRIPQDARVVGSYHTHGAYLPGFDNEVPSLLDLQVEMEWQIDGYVSTPGGRFWHVDGRRGQVTLICGPGCMPRDARFEDQSRVFGKIRDFYNVDSLLRRTFLGAAGQ